MKIFLGADHGGFELKEKIKTWLTEWGFEFEDLGNTVNDPDDDYPDFAFRVSDRVSKTFESLGILACRSSAGMIICANKVKRIRAVSVTDPTSTVHAREHNDANIIGLSGDWLTDEAAKEIVHVFLSTKFPGDERHQRRIDKIKKFEDMIYD